MRQAINFLKKKIKVIKRRLGIIEEFNKNEIDALIKLYDDNNLDMYSFKIFQRARELAKGKYDLITEDFFYNNLAAKVAVGYANHRPVLNTRLDYINMILGDFTTIDITLNAVADAYKGYTIGSR